MSKPTDDAFIIYVWSTLMKLITFLLFISKRIFMVNLIHVSYLTSVLLLFYYCFIMILRCYDSKKRGAENFRNLFIIFQARELVYLLNFNLFRNDFKIVPQSYLNKFNSFQQDIYQSRNLQNGG